MITKFDTSNLTSVKKSNANTIVAVIVVAAALYCGYRFYWLPKQIENEQK